MTSLGAGPNKRGGEMWEGFKGPWIAFFGPWDWNLVARIVGETLGVFSLVIIGTIILMFVVYLICR